MEQTTNPSLAKRMLLQWLRITKFSSNQNHIVAIFLQTAANSVHSAVIGQIINDRTDYFHKLIFEQVLKFPCSNLLNVRLIKCQISKCCIAPIRSDAVFYSIKIGYDVRLLFKVEGTQAHFCIRL